MNNTINDKTELIINKRLSQINNIADEAQKQRELAIHKDKCSKRAIVEHPFAVIKSLFGFRKTRYKGKEKNEALMNILYTSANLVEICQKGINLKATYSAVSTGAVYP